MFARAVRQATKSALGPVRDGLTVGASLYGKRGKPERAMVELRREILQIIRVRLEKERLGLEFDERMNGQQTNSIESKSNSPGQKDEL
jgi:hypothetical protein